LQAHRHEHRQETSEKESLARRALAIDLIFENTEFEFLRRDFGIDAGTGGGEDDDLDLLSGKDAALHLDADTGKILGRL